MRQNLTCFDYKRDAQGRFRYLRPKTLTMAVLNRLVDDNPGLRNKFRHLGSIEEAKQKKKSWGKVLSLYPVFFNWDTYWNLYMTYFCCEKVFQLPLDEARVAAQAVRERPFESCVVPHPVLGFARMRAPTPSQRDAIQFRRGISDEEGYKCCSEVNHLNQNGHKLLTPYLVLYRGTFFTPKRFQLEKDIVQLLRDAPKNVLYVSGRGAPHRCSGITNAKNTTLEDLKLALRATRAAPPTSPADPGAAEEATPFYIEDDPWCTGIPGNVFDFLWRIAPGAYVPPPPSAYLENWNKNGKLCLLQLDEDEAAAIPEAHFVSNDRQRQNRINGPWTPPRKNDWILLNGKIDQIVYISERKQTCTLKGGANILLRVAKRAKAGRCTPVLGRDGGRVDTLVVFLDKATMNFSHLYDCVLRAKKKCIVIEQEKDELKTILGKRTGPKPQHHSPLLDFFLKV